LTDSGTPRADSGRSAGRGECRVESAGLVSSPEPTAGC